MRTMVVVAKTICIDFGNLIMVMTILLNNDDDIVNTKEDDDDRNRITSVCELGAHKVLWIQDKRQPTTPYIPPS